VPSSSLSNLYGLAIDAQSREILGEGVDLDIEAHDETKSGCRWQDIRRFKRNANRGVVLLVGVQTNQFAARDRYRARIARRRNPGCDWRIPRQRMPRDAPEMPPEMKDALAMGITLFAGEAERRSTSC